MTTTPSIRGLAVSLGALVAIGPFAIDTYLPALPRMAEHFQVDISTVERSVSLYLIGAAIGQLFGGPVSDRVGRKPVALLGLALFLIGSLLIPLAASVLWLDALRILQALGGGVTVITCGATVRDHFHGREAARMITAIGMVMLLAPLIAPAVGTVLLHLGGWQLIFLVLGGYSLMLMLVVIYALPEARPAIGPVETAGLFTRWGRVLGYSPGPMLILCNGFSFSAIFAFITDSAFLYLEFYDVGTTVFPVLFGANVVAMLALNRLNMLLLRRYEAHKIMWWGLWALLLVAVWLVLLFTTTARPTLWLVVPSLMLLGGLVALVMPNGVASLLHLFPKDSGSASGLNGTGQFLLAGGAGTMLSLLHDGTPVPMVTVMLVSAALALVCRGLAGRKHDLMHPAPGQTLPSPRAFQ